MSTTSTAASQEPSYWPAESENGASGVLLEQVVETEKGSFKLSFLARSCFRNDNLSGYVGIEAKSMETDQVLLVPSMPKPLGYAHATAKMSSANLEGNYQEQFDKISDQFFEKGDQIKKEIQDALLNEQKQHGDPSKGKDVNT